MTFRVGDFVVIKEDVRSPGGISYYKGFLFKINVIFANGGGPPSPHLPMFARSYDMEYGVLIQCLDFPLVETVDEI